MDQLNRSGEDAAFLHPSRFSIHLSLAAIGCTAIVGQILLMRSLLVIFQGNEISLGLILAVWLVWVAAGVALAGRLSGRVSRPKPLLGGLQMLAGLALPGSILLVRKGPSFWEILPGEMVGPDVVLAVSVLTLGGFCLISGGLFAVASRVLTVHMGFQTADATSSVYLWEALGSGAGGLLCSLILLDHLSTLEIAFLIFWLNVVAGTLLFFKAGRGRVLAALFSALFLTIILSGTVRKWEFASIEALWSGFRITESVDSRYANLVVAERERNRILFANGVSVVSAPDTEAAEEAVHYALLQHAEPAEVLLIGGGINGSVFEVLKHPSVKHLVYLELDPQMIELARKYLSESWNRLEQDSRVETLFVDGRHFLKSTGGKAFDAVIVNVPDPFTAQLNRYYTAEFFREVKDRLLPGGLLSFSVSGAENYIGEEQANFLQCLNQTFRMVFPHVAVLPGPTIHFFGTDSGTPLTLDPDLILGRLRSRNIQTEYVREYFLPFRLSQDRVGDLEARIRPKSNTRINRDFSPAAYYFNIILWTTQFRGLFRSAFSALAQVDFRVLVIVVLVASFLPLIWSLLGRGGQSRRAWGAQYAVFAMGLTVMSLQVVLLLGFQAIFGFVYYQLALLVAAAMLGMGLGAWLCLHRGDERLVTLFLLQSSLGVLPLAFYGSLEVLAEPVGWQILLGQILIPLMALASGFLGGYHFPLASRIYFGVCRKEGRGLGRLYALDLLGACLGAIALSTYLIPVFAFFESSLLVSLVNLAPCLLLFAALPDRA